MTILEQLAASTAERVAARKRAYPAELLRRQAEAMGRGAEFPFETALRGSGIALICEVKKASPSKGVIASDFPYLQIARDYEAGGADALSVLTEPERFLGRDTYLREIAAQAEIPVLRKDFTVEPYMIYEAKVLGASAVLLICAILDEARLREYIAVADSLGLSALVEAHTAQEVETALRAGARLVGVNNRDLHTFAVDLAISEQLRGMVPREFPFVAESGIRTAEDVARLKRCGVDAALVGETLMRCTDKGKAIHRLRGGLA